MVVSIFTRSSIENCSTHGSAYKQNNTLPVTPSAPVPSADLKVHSQNKQYHIGTVITTSSFTSGAETSANQDFIRLIDGDRLTDIMIESSIGVVTDDESYELDPTFWSAFEKPERTDSIPPLEVPQADNFDVIHCHPSGWNGF